MNLSRASRISIIYALAVIGILAGIFLASHNLAADSPPETSEPDPSQSRSHIATIMSIDYPSSIQLNDWATIKVTAKNNGSSSIMIVAGMS